MRSIAGKYNKYPLSPIMSPAKVARVLAAWQVGSGDYLITRERLFAGETVQTLAEKIQAFQDGEPSK